MRKFLFGKHGLKENPTEQVVTWSVGEREYLARVTGVTKKRISAGDYEVLMLQTRFFCGNKGPDVPARDVFVLEQD
jgi:hypothetical protein